MNKRYYLIIVPIALVALWNIIGIGLMRATSLIYSVDGLAKVIAVHEASVQLEMVSTSRINVQATCHRQVVCENSITLASDECPIHVEEGKITRKEFPLPIAAFNGSDNVTCHYMGLITMKPFGGWGPELAIPWKSEPFTATRPAPR